MRGLEKLFQTAFERANSVRAFGYLLIIIVLMKGLKLEPFASRFTGFMSLIEYCRVKQTIKKFEFFRSICEVYSPFWFPINVSW